MRTITKRSEKTTIKESEKEVIDALVKDYSLIEELITEDKIDEPVIWFRKYI